MRIFPPPVAKKRARANSFPRDRPRTLVGGRAAVDLRRKQNLKRNDRKTLSPSPFPLARFGRNDDSARLGPQLRPLVRNRYPRSFARFIARRGSHRTRRAKKRRLSVEQDVISAEYPIGEMQIAFRRCYSQPCILSIYIHIYRRAMRFAPVRKSCLSSSIVDTDTMEGKRKKPISAFDRYQLERVDENN